MKTILSLRRHHYLKTVGILLIAVALIAGTVSCGGGATYELTMAADPAAGGTATDLTGASPYTALTAVNISAVAASCYRFVDWTAPAGLFGDKNAAQTTFIMPDRDVTVTANFVAVYDLTMAEAPAAGGTATDETGTSPYARNDVVDIKAVPADCYRFVDWSTTAGAIGNTTAAETTFTMPAEDVTVTANFELTPPDHFKFYVVDEGGPYVGKDVQLVDQFVAINATVGEAVLFGNPVKKVHDGEPTLISDPDRHFTLYNLEYEEEPQSWQVTVTNQFQDKEELTVYGPFWLAVPTTKVEPGGHEAPVCLDHFLVYEVIPSPWLEEPMTVVELYDQFLDEPEVGVWDPIYFANPVEKTLLPGGAPTPIEHEDEHMVFYAIDGCPFEKKVQIDNQFGEQTIDLIWPDTLAVPSQKVSWEQPLNHFKSYWVDEMPPIGEVVQLEDQFVTITANVTYPIFFANPAEKWHGVEFSELSRIWDPRDHLMSYLIDILDGEEGMWEVTVDNQFGIGQWLRVAGPIAVIVPTEKIPHGPPEDLNHFLVYGVLDWEVTPYEEVLLWDQFTEFEPEWNTVCEPMLFAVPAQKTVLGGAPTPIIGDEHLLFYGIDGGLGFWEPIVSNQFFGPEPIPVYQGDGEWFPPFDFLGVPSQKISWNPWEPL